MEAKYPYFTAYFGFLALTTIASLILNFILTLIIGVILGPGYVNSIQLVMLIATIVISFYIFRYVIRKYILPNVIQGEEQTQAKVA